MPIFKRAMNVATWSPPQVGEPCHAVSLTADEGTWVKLGDFKGHLNVIFLVFRNLSNPDTDAWLQAWNSNKDQFEQLDTVVFGITTARTDQLREHRTRLGLDFFLLYDPLAVTSRAMRCSSRVRPTCKNNVVAVGKDGQVVYAERGLTDPRVLLEEMARIEGRSVDDLDSPEAESQSTSFTDVRTPGNQPDAIRKIDSAAAEQLLGEKDGGYVLVDVRTSSEYEADHSPAAVHIPIDELPHRYRDLAQTTRIICICQAGGRSAAAAEFLTSIGGSEIYDVTGGMSAWSGERVTGGERQA